MRTCITGVLILTSFLTGIALGWRANEPFRRQIALTLETIHAAKIAVEACKNLIPSPEEEVTPEWRLCAAWSYEGRDPTETEDQGRSCAQ